MREARAAAGTAKQEAAGGLWDPQHQRPPLGQKDNLQKSCLNIAKSEGLNRDAPD
jgi:hypothetical protein